MSEDKPKESLVGYIIAGGDISSAIANRVLKDPVIKEKIESGERISMKDIRAARGNIFNK